MRTSNRVKLSVPLVYRSLCALFLVIAACDAEPEPIPEDVVFGFDLGPMLDFGDIGGSSVVDFEAGPTGDLDPNDPGVEVTGTDSRVQDVCIPKCTGKQCGDDSCGGVCGECNPGTSCNEAGLCETNGDLCSAPLVITNFPTTLTAEMTGFSDNFDCGDGLGYSDLVLELRPGAGVPVYSTVSGPGQLELSSSNSCKLNATCDVSGASALTTTPSGNTAFVVVEQLDASAEGPITVTVQRCSSFCDSVTCGPNPCGLQCGCGVAKSCVDGLCIDTLPGDSCTESPLPISELPFNTSGAISGFSDSESCSNVDLQLPDVVRVYSPPFDSNVTLTLMGDPGVVLWITENECNGTCSNPIFAGESTGKALSAAKTYYFVIEGPMDSAYSLNVESCEGKPCSASCPCSLGSACTAGACITPTGGDSCAEPVSFDSTIAWSTTALTNQIQCGDSSPAAAEGVFSFVAPTSGTYSFTAEGPTEFRLHQLNSCTNSEVSCTLSADNPSRISVDLDALATIYLAVEDLNPSESGGFSLTAENCTAKCEDATCDTPACGSICGCPFGETCAAGACVTAAPLDTCTTAEDLTSSPTVITGTLEGLTDALFCESGVGAGTPEAVYRFIAPETGVYSAAVIGPAMPQLFFPYECGGASGCSPLFANTMKFLAKGDTLWLAIDGPVNSAYELSVSRVLGIPGSLGHGCANNSDCPLAEYCIAGVCTVECDGTPEETACIGAAAGPRGINFGCADEMCSQTDSGCITTCLPLSDEVAACNGPADCSNGICAGIFSLQNTNAYTGACLNADPTSLILNGPCDKATDCATNLCISGVCASPCLSTSECEGSQLCQYSAGISTGPNSLGTCFSSINAIFGSACNADGDCEVGYCDAHVSPDGIEQYCALTVGAQALGTACVNNTDCKYASCIFNNDIGFEPPYCSRFCNSDAECTPGLSCRPLTIDDLGTVDLGDDITINRCVKGTANQSCTLMGYDICDTGLTCTDVGLQQGVCQ